MTKAAELAKMGEVLTNSQIGGRRNIVINGGMNVAQRSTSETGLGASSGYFTLDRFQTTFGSTAGRLTMSQVAVTDLPGFANALKLDCTTADTSIAAGENFRLQTLLEGQDLQQLKKGTSSAEKFTVSFYVKGNASATYMLELFDGDNSRHNTQQFAVTSSWNRISLTFAGDTTGAFDDDNAVSLYLNFWLHAGSTYTGGTYTANTWASNTNANRAVGISSFFDSTDRTLEITGLQMEIGSVATPFEHRSFGEELALCQRYFQKYSDNGLGSGYISNGYIDNDRYYGVTRFANTLRANPTCAGTSGDFAVQSSAYSASGFSIDEQHNPTVDSVRFRTGTNSNFTNGQGAILKFGEAGSVTVDAEL
tara:strand:- start:47 stop:1141 length:1095 start_codon:yes stop_codon:yes gene_type:complete